ncbi:MAG: diguanylate cyclase [Coxiellaceae bacterium]|nr:diguanylate cyclase [Coxiellaceae bacterium]
MSKQSTLNQVDIIPNILIVDDRTENIIAMKKILSSKQMLNVNIYEAQSGDEALSLMLEHEFSVILLDVQMPEMDGFELASLMQSNDLTSRIPIIFVSAINKDEQHSIKGHELGAVDFIFKPVNPSILINKVMVFCKLYCREKKLEIALEENRKIRAMLESSNNELNYLANYDVLTKIPNRLSFESSIELIIASAKRHGRLFALMLIDLDNFKGVNDTYGHDIGDKLLQAVSEKLQSCFRSDDMIAQMNGQGIIARMGGDEFAIILNELSDTNDAGIVASRAIKSVSAVYEFGDVTISTSMSIGIACYPVAGNNYSTLYKHADVALYSAKGQGKNTYQYYSDELQARHTEHMKLENQIVSAIENNLLSLYYQPIYQLQENNIIGFEALIRMQVDDDRILAASDFIDIASHCGIVMPIYNWVIEEAQKQQLEWLDLGFDQDISINLSTKQITDHDSIDAIKRFIETMQSKEKCMHVELLESEILSNENICSQIEAAFGDSSMVVALDDFTSVMIPKLESLCKTDINFNAIKICDAIISDIDENEVNQSIVRCILEVAHKLNLIVIAKGIQTQGEYDCLLKMGCDHGQGFYLMKPLPAAEATKLLQK